jgi:BMFP domain-containing protein YqiC
MQQQHGLQIQSLENTIEELESRQPEPDMEQVTALREQLNGVLEEFSNQYQILEKAIEENQAMHERISELTAAKSTELEAHESPRKRVPVVNMELAKQALAEQIRVLNLDPEALKKERREKHDSERQRNHVIGGFTYAGEVIEIVAPITPNDLSLRNYYGADQKHGDGNDQRYWYIEFRKLTFQDDPKTAEGLGIFNDAVLYEAHFRNCKFHSIDFSRIDPKIFEKIKFNEGCRFEGTTKLPTGFKLEDGKIAKSEEAAEIPRPIMKSRPPTDLRSSFDARSLRANIHAKPATLLGSTRGGGREEN